MGKHLDINDRSFDAELGWGPFRHSNRGQWLHEFDSLIASEVAGGKRRAECRCIYSVHSTLGWHNAGNGLSLHMRNNSRNRFVCARLTGISEPLLSFILSMKLDLNHGTTSLIWLIFTR